MKYTIILLFISLILVSCSFSPGNENKQPSENLINTEQWNIRTNSGNDNNLPAPSSLIGR